MTGPQKHVARLIGAILRAARSAAERNLDAGPHKPLMPFFREIRTATDEAERICREVSNGE
jgi:hypothetical protein